MSGCGSFTQMGLGDNAICGQPYLGDGIFECATCTITRLAELLKVARCPDPSCTDGVIPHQVGDNEWEAQQCQWCYEREAAVDG